MVTDPMRQLAVLCGNKLKESFPETDYYLHSRGVNSLGEESFSVEIIGRASRSPMPDLDYLLLRFHFYEDHVMIYTTKFLYHRVPYNDPKLIDILLSELKKQIGNR